MSVRDDLATAASTAPGVAVTPGYRQTAKPGEGWVGLARTDYPDPFGICTWQVIVVLPQSRSAAEDWLDANQLGLVQALQGAMQVTSAVPLMVQLDTTQVPALVVEGKRAESDTP